MKRWLIVIVLVAAFIGGVLATGSRWEGDVTEAATEPLAQQTGMEEKQVLPWSVEGDLLLFVFLTGGAAAGFAFGYNWHKLFGSPGNKPGDEKREQGLGRGVA